MVESLPSILSTGSVMRGIAGFPHPEPFILSLSKDEGRGNPDRFQENVPYRCSISSSAPSVELMRRRSPSSWRIASALPNASRALPISLLLDIAAAAMMQQEMLLLADAGLGAQHQRFAKQLLRQALSRRDIAARWPSPSMISISVLRSPRRRANAPALRPATVRPPPLAPSMKSAKPRLPKASSCAASSAAPRPLPARSRWRAISLRSFCGSGGT